jgi:hypothetical protein
MKYKRQPVLSLFWAFGYSCGSCYLCFDAFVWFLSFVIWCFFIVSKPDTACIGNELSRKQIPYSILQITHL